MKTLMTVAAMACATLTAGTASAGAIIPAEATVTKSYTYVAEFSEGPYKQITGSFTATFNQLNLDYAPSSTSAVEISLPAQYKKDFNAFITNGYLVFGSSCFGSVCIVRPDLLAYAGAFVVKADGGVQENYSFLYSVNKKDYIASSFAVSEVSAVPEPATWALMLAGFAMVGGAIRYRRHNTMVRCA